MDNVGLSTAFPLKHHWYEFYVSREDPSTDGGSKATKPCLVEGDASASPWWNLASPL